MLGRTYQASEASPSTASAASCQRHIRNKTSDHRLGMLHLPQAISVLKAVAASSETAKPAGLRQLRRKLPTDPGTHDSSVGVMYSCALSHCLAVFGGTVNSRASSQAVVHLRGRRTPAQHDDLMWLFTVGCVRRKPSAMVLRIGFGSHLGDLCCGRSVA